MIALYKVIAGVEQSEFIFQKLSFITPFIITLRNPFFNLLADKMQFQEKMKKKNQEQQFS